MTRIGYILIHLSALFLLSCGQPGGGRSWAYPPPAFQQHDLVGMWGYTNTLYDYTETLIVQQDGRFIHTVLFAKPAQHYVDQGTWKLDMQANGCTYLQLQGMRYFHETRETADRGNRDPDGQLIRFEEPCTMQSLEMPNRVILTVGNSPVSPQHIELLFPRIEVDGRFIALTKQQ